MTVSAAAIPATLPTSTVEALVGPLGTVAGLAVVIAFGVLIVGLLTERRDARQRALVRAELSSPSERHAA
jgi:hypothetical protein